MPIVGRKRRADKDLPRYWKRSHGAIYLIVPSKHASVGKIGSWIRLGDASDESSCHRTFADLLAGERAGTMQQLFDRYEKDILPKKATKTQIDQKRQLHLLANWCGKKPLGALRRVEVQRFVDSRPPVAGNRELSLLSHICKKGIRWGMIENNPCMDVERNAEKPAREGADPLSMMLAWKAACPWMRALMAVAYVVGQRRGDVRRIRETDFGIDGLRLKQCKTETDLLLRWTLNLRYVRDYALSVRPVTPIGRYLICTRQGTPVSEAHFKREWAKVKEAVAKGGGTPFMFKSIRAQSATDHESGNHLGHTDERTLRKHYRLGPKSVTPI